MKITKLELTGVSFGPLGGPGVDTSGAVLDTG